MMLPKVKRPRLCGKCRTKMSAMWREDNRRRYRIARRNGVCVSCTKKAVPGMVRCRKHRDAFNVYQKRRYARG